MKISYQLNILIFNILLLSACQTNLKKSSQTTAMFNNWQQINSWSISGKMAINDGHNNGSGKFKWQHTNMTTVAKFSAPLGQGSWNIKETPSKAELTSSKHGPMQAATAQQLVSNELGWHFPWNNLKFWLRGHQSNLLSKNNLSVHHILPDSFNDNGWHIEFLSWTVTPMGMLPKRIKASNNSYSIKLIIYSWDIQ